MNIENLMVEDPESIGALEEVEEVLNSIIGHQNSNGGESGVLLIQRKQYPGLYIIASATEADKQMSQPVHPSTPEFGIRFWPISYFEQIKQNLQTQELTHK